MTPPPPASRVWTGTLTPPQIFCLAWAARPGLSRPPLEYFGVHKNGWGGGYLATPSYRSSTWRSLVRRRLVVLDDMTGVCRATDAGVAWLRAHGLYDKAMEGSAR